MLEVPGIRVKGSAVVGKGSGVGSPVTGGRSPAELAARLTRRSAAIRGGSRVSWVLTGPSLAPARPRQGGSPNPLVRVVGRLRSRYWLPGPGQLPLPGELGHGRQGAPQVLGLEVGVDLGGELGGAVAEGGLGVGEGQAGAGQAGGEGGARGVDVELLAAGVPLGYGGAVEDAVQDPHGVGGGLGPGEAVGGEEHAVVGGGQGAEDPLLLGTGLSGKGVRGDAGGSWGMHA